MISNITTENACGPALVPMWSMSGLRSLLGINEDKILNLIDQNRLPWAFDFGLGNRLELRLMPQSAAAYQAGTACALSWEDVEKLFVPGLRDTRPGIVAKVTGLFIQRACNISCTHLASLIECGQIQAARQGRSGKGNSTEITAASFFDFLKRKRFR
jgi:hypothetical protein